MPDETSFHPFIERRLMTVIGKPEETAPLKPGHRVWALGINDHGQYGIVTQPNDSVPELFVAPKIVY